MSKYLTVDEWGQILALAWQNPEFKNEFEKDPRKALNQHKKDFTGRLAEKDVECIIELPEKPEGIDLEAVANGTCKIICPNIPLAC